MRPKKASCNQCHAQLSFFTEELPKNCPTCKALLRVEEFDKCQKCFGKVELGTTFCQSCRSSGDPGYAAYPPEGPGVKGSVN